MKFPRMVYGFVEKYGEESILTFEENFDCVPDDTPYITYYVDASSPMVANQSPRRTRKATKRELEEFDVEA